MKVWPQPPVKQILELVSLSGFRWELTFPDTAAPGSLATGAHVGNRADLTIRPAPDMSPAPARQTPLRLINAVKCLIEQRLADCDRAGGRGAAVVHAAARGLRDEDALALAV